MPRAFQDYRTLFADLYESVGRMHVMSPNQHRGHGLDHDVTVAQTAVLVAPDEKTADKAWVAAMIHSTDRLVEPAQLEPTLQMYAGKLVHFFGPAEVTEILTAVKRHDKFNERDDSLTQQVLMDADRLVNLQPLLIVRAGQHYAHVPAIEVEHIGKENPNGRSNPASTFREPRNVLDDIRGSLEWESDPKFCLRLPEAKRRGAEYFQYLRDFIEKAETPYRELGLVGIEL